MEHNNSTIGTCTIYTYLCIWMVRLSLSVNDYFVNLLILLELILCSQSYSCILFVFDLWVKVLSLSDNEYTVVGLLYYTLSFSDSINRYLMVMETLRKLSSKKISDF